MTLDEARRAVEVGIEVATTAGARLGQPGHRRHGDRATPRPRRRWSARSPAPTRPRPPAAAPAIDDPTWERKVAVVARAMRRVPGRPVDPGGGAGRAGRGRRPRARRAGRVRHRGGRAPDPGAPRRRHRRGGRARGGRRCARPRWSTRCRGARVARGGPRAGAASTSGCARCSGSTSASARGPAPCSRCRWSPARPGPCATSPPSTPRASRARAADRRCAPTRSPVSPSCRAGLSGGTTRIHEFHQGIADRAFTRGRPGRRARSRRRTTPSPGSRYGSVRLALGAGARLAGSVAALRADGRALDDARAGRVALGDPQRRARRPASRGRPPPSRSG